MIIHDRYLRFLSPSLPKKYRNRSSPPSSPSHLDSRSPGLSWKARPIAKKHPCHTSLATQTSDRGDVQLAEGPYLGEEKKVGIKSKLNISHLASDKRLKWSGKDLESRFTRSWIFCAEVRLRSSSFIPGWKACSWWWRWSFWVQNGEHGTNPSFLMVSPLASTQLHAV